MSTHGELIELIQEKLQERSVSPARITTQLNKAILYVFGKVILPAQESGGSFTTVLGSYYADIPAIWNFGRNLYSARTDECSLLVLPSVTHLIEKPGINLDVLIEGQPRYITTVGNRLMYAHAPATPTTVYCRFYEKPAPLVKTNDIPTCIPEEYHEVLLKNYVLWHAYELKEDGMEGLKINTNHHKGQFEEALSSFDAVTITGVSEPELDRTTTWI